MSKEEQSLKLKCVALVLQHHNFTQGSDIIKQSKSVSGKLNI